MLCSYYKLRLFRDQKLVPHRWQDLLAMYHRYGNTRFLILGGLYGLFLFTIQPLIAPFGSVWNEYCNCELNMSCKLILHELFFSFQYIYLVNVLKMSGMYGYEQTHPWISEKGLGVGKHSWPRAYSSNACTRSGSIFTESRASFGTGMLYLSCKYWPCNFNLKRITSPPI
jgi:hypothetical protein